MSKKVLDAIAKREASRAKSRTPKKKASAPKSEVKVEEQAEA